MDTAGYLKPSQAEQIKATRIIDYEQHGDLVTKIDDFLKEYFLNDTKEELDDGK